MKTPRVWVDPGPEQPAPGQSTAVQCPAPTAVCRPAKMNRSLRFGAVGQRWMTVELTDGSRTNDQGPDRLTSDQALDLLLRE